MKDTMERPALMAFGDIAPLSSMKAHDIIQYFAKKAYGNAAEVTCHGTHVVVVVDGAPLFLMKFTSKCKMHNYAFKHPDAYEPLENHASGGSNGSEGPGEHTSWKNVLEQIAGCIDSGGFVSYLPDEKTMLEPGSSLEEALISLELGNGGKP